MLPSIIILLLPFLAIAFLPVIVKSFFSAAELDAIGICLEKSEMMSSYSFQGSDRTFLKMTVTCISA
jgi:hypothetical protein